MASKAIKDHGSDLIESSAVRSSVVPICVLYGANASGKTNFYSALRRIRSHVTKSFTSRQPQQEIPRDYFKLDSTCGELPTRFDCDVVVSGVRYHYGFEFDSKEYLAEWLHSFPDGRRRLLFERQDGRINFGSSLKGNNKAIEQIGRPNALYLSTAAQASHDILLPIFQYFEEMWQGVGAGFEAGIVAREFDSEVDPRLIQFLKHADTGVSSATVRKKERDQRSKRMMEGFFNVMKEVAVETGSEFPMETLELDEDRVLVLGHSAGEGRIVELPLLSESRGTIRLLSLMAEIFQALDRGRVLCIDEVDVSLHPLIVAEILALFARRETNPLGAQLIVTTHDAHLIGSPSLRRDQIWFCEKNGRGESRAYPLSDFKTRNTDNIERQYLAGRYGAVPRISPFRGEILEEEPS